MAWKLLPTDYTDAVWSGLKRYTQVDNSDGTVSFNDVTTYTNKDGNRHNLAVKPIDTFGQIGQPHTYFYRADALLRHEPAVSRFGRGNRSLFGNIFRRSGRLGIGR